MLKVCSGYTTLTLAPKSANFILDCYYSNKKLPIQYERIIVLAHCHQGCRAGGCQFHASPHYAQTTLVMSDYGSEDSGHVL